MLIRKSLLLLGLSVLFVGCSINRCDDGSNNWMRESDRGLQYLLGRNVAQNNEKAFYHFNKAANDDDEAFAQNEVAYMYAAGKGTKQDFKKALTYYKKAANHGLSSAQYNLGLMYLYGLGTVENKKIALQWLKKSASKGFEPAQKVLTKQS